MLFQVMPGHANLVALSAVKLKAENDLRRLLPKDRNCLFPDENKEMKFHRNYSQTNCFFECSLIFAQDKLRIEKNTTMCTPWYFPFNDENFRICDPWETEYLITIIELRVPKSECDRCLPDCNRVIYQKSISTQAFRKCDERNFGMSSLCSLNNIETQLKPQMWGKLALEKLENLTQGKSAETYLKFKSQIMSSKRTLKPKMPNANFLSNSNVEYDAFEKDIAVLSVFFDSPTILEYSTKHSRTWIDFISAVGGNGGLFIGFSLVTILEIFWFFYQLILVYATGI